MNSVLPVRKLVAHSESIRSRSHICTAQRKEEACKVTNLHVLLSRCGSQLVSTSPAAHRTQQQTAHGHVLILDVHSLP
jgi:hypothetical protein